MSKEEELVLNRYHVHLSYTDFQRRMILVCGGLVALMTPFTDTIYLPALHDVGISLNASNTNVALSVSAYLASAAVGQLFWGSLSDYFGRLPVLVGSLFLFQAFTIGCIFPINIITLIILRTFQGFIVAGGITSVQASIADVFIADERGVAMASILVPLLIGPIVAPLVGGILCDAYSWRATFVLLAIMNIPVALLVIFLTPETHPWYVLQKRGDYVRQESTNKLGKMSREASEKALQHLSSSDSDISKPLVVYPWTTMAVMFERQLRSHYMLAGTLFACHTTCLQQLLV